MRLVIQRVSSASVEVEEFVVAEIETGLLILAGIEEADSKEDIDWLVKKVCQLRIFNDAEGVMNLSVQDDWRKNHSGKPVYFARLNKKGKPAIIHSCRSSRNGHSALRGFD